MADELSEHVWPINADRLKFVLLILSQESFAGRFLKPSDINASAFLQLFVYASCHQGVKFILSQTEIGRES